jgi:cytochrome c oxidase subunit II
LLPPSLLLLATSCRFGEPNAPTSQGQDMGGLYRTFVVIAIVVGAIVYALIFWSILRYRRRSDRLPEQTRYHIPLEVTYTLIPVAIVLALFVMTFRTETRVDHLVDGPAVVVRVTGFQWQWEFDYPSAGVRIIGTTDRPPTMVLPVGQTVQIDLASRDVNHSLYVPDFLFKRDAIPGVRNRFDWTLQRSGTFRGECAEYCGLNHAYMTFYVKAVPPARFRQWLDTQPSLATGGSTP